tara:strand:- start:524 stop:670 length:147 start_codon:yes stop_codon:yes gene_type:complete
MAASVTSLAAERPLRAAGKFAASGLVAGAAPHATARGRLNAAAVGTFS